MYIVPNMRELSNMGILSLIIKTVIIQPKNRKVLELKQHLCRIAGGIMAPLALSNKLYYTMLVFLDFPMKSNTHPTYYPDAKVVCACGNTFSVGSTQKETHTEICSNCHPFFTGKQNLVDTAGRVDRFKAKMEKTTKLKAKKAESKAKKSQKKETAEKPDTKAKLEKIKESLDNK